MFRAFLTTTAVTALLATGAIAQDTTTPATPAAPATEAPATDNTMTPAAPAATDSSATAAAGSVESILATGYTVTDKDNLATEIIGKQVYSSTANDAEHIGDINNLVIGENGEVAAVVIGVGGFLGIGEKNVAVNFAELQYMQAEDGSERYVLNTTKEALETAPDFRAEDDVDGAAAPADNTMAPADNNTMAPADNTMAPAPADPNAAPAAPAAPAN